tara:strand:- start:3895 stop:4143 length:249 start_codon:yes stop_codon:yes gene_type:complete
VIATIADANVDADVDADEVQLRQLISRAYPFGERAMHPYKIWLEEVKFYFNPDSMKGRQFDTVDAGKHRPFETLPAQGEMQL